MKTLAEQLLAAMEAKDWSFPKLLVESGLKCTRWSLMRKLRGEQKLSTEECQKLAAVLGVTIAWAAPDDEDEAHAS